MGVLHFSDQKSLTGLAPLGSVRPGRESHLLRLVTGRTEVIHDFEDRLGEPFSRDVSSIIEPEG
jgi:hypothetical protein